MRAFISLTVLLLAAEASARPIVASRGILIREVPQEHSHEQFLTTVRVSLNLNNPAGIVDPVFGLLGNAVSPASPLARRSFLADQTQGRFTRSRLNHRS